MSWKSCSASLAASVAVGSSKIITFARCAECPGHRDQLLLSGAERSHGPFGRDPQAHLREQRPPLGWSL